LFTPIKQIEKAAAAERDNSIIVYDNEMKIHPLVRDLYKRALVVGHDYPLGLDYIRRTWKDALRNPSNCPSCYQPRQQQQGIDVTDRDNRTHGDHSRNKYNAQALSLSQQVHLVPIPYDEYTAEQERELRKAVGKGRYMIREMIGVIQLKKYRSMKRRYGNKEGDGNSAYLNYQDLIGAATTSGTESSSPRPELVSRLNGQSKTGRSGGGHDRSP
jgi:hypothetical protein